MFIETESTPNPATLKFLLGQEVRGHKSADFPNAESAATDPLARFLFSIPGVARVFFGSDFVSVTSTDAADWRALKPQILGALMEHLSAGGAFTESAEPEAAEDILDADREVVEQIKELIETRVRPAVLSDGGDIVFRGYRDGVVSLQMQGACSGCPSSTATLKHGIQNMLKHYVPEVTSVVEVGF
jgi:Fe-S cluster biogenesis protein NfuA